MVVREPLAGHFGVDEGREEQAERRRGVQQRARFDARFFGDDFRDHRGTRGPFAADPEARDDTAQDQLPHLGDEGARGGAERVEQHREHEHAFAPEAVADRAEDHAARRPAEQQQGVQDAGPVWQRLLGFRSADREV